MGAKIQASSFCFLALRLACLLAPILSVLCQYKHVSHLFLHTEGHAELTACGNVENNPQHNNPYYNPCYAPDIKKNNVPIGGPVPYKPNCSDKQTN